MEPTWASWIFLVWAVVLLLSQALPTPRQPVFNNGLCGPVSQKGANVANNIHAPTLARPYDVTKFLPDGSSNIQPTSRPEQRTTNAEDIAYTSPFEEEWMQPEESKDLFPNPLPRDYPGDQTNINTEATSLLATENNGLDGTPADTMDEATPVPETIFKCSHCSRTFKSKDYLIRHVTIHDAPSRLLCPGQPCHWANSFPCIDKLRDSSTSGKVRLCRAR